MSFTLVFDYTQTEIVKNYKFFGGLNCLSFLNTNIWHEISLIKAMTLILLGQFEPVGLC